MDLFDNQAGVVSVDGIYVSQESMDRKTSLFVLITTTD